MSYKLIGGGSSLETVVSDVNQNILELKGREVTEIFKDDTGTRRVLLGKGSDGFYGLKVSQPTFDVFTAADDELIFNSDQNVFKIVDKISSSIDFSVGGAGGGSHNVAHGQSYTPLILATVDITSASGSVNSGLFTLPYFKIAAASPNPLIEGSITVNGISSTNVNFFYAFGSATTCIGTITIYVLQETAN